MNVDLFDDNIVIVNVKIIVKYLDFIVDICHDLD